MDRVRFPFVRAFAACFVFCLTAMLIVGGGDWANAKDDVDPDAYRQYDIGDGRVSLDVQDARFGDVIREKIQAATRVNIFVSPEAAEQLVTLRAVELHWLHVLAGMTENIGGVFIREADRLIKIERPRPFTYTFTNEDIKEVVKNIVDFAGANVVIPSEITGSVTMVLNNTPWREALKQAVKAAGYALVEEEYGILRVVALDKLETESGYYRFRYLRPPAPYKGVISSGGNTGGTSGGTGGGTSGGTSGTSGGSGGGDIVVGNAYVPTDNPADQEELFPIVAALRNVVGENGSVTYVPVQNLIIYSGTRPRLRELKSIVKSVDVEPPQVFIDMNFIVTSNNDVIELGLKPPSTGFGMNFTGSDIVHMLPFAVGSPGGLENSITGTSFSPVPSGSFSYGALDFNQINLLYSFLQRDTSSRIVQAPKLLALDNQEATIFIGESIRYARSTATTNQNGGLEFAIEEDPNSPVNVGFQLLVIPHVIPGEQKIMMTVIPQRRTLTGNTSNLPGFDRFTVGANSIDLPRVQSNTLVTHMILNHRQMAVIGGLMEDREIETVDKVPFFGDLPVAGLLFQGKNSSTVKEHLLITITTRILHGTDATNCVISDELMGRAEQAATEYSDLEGQAVRYPGQGESIKPDGNGEGLPVAPGR